MGIYLPNMEMPTSCTECPCCRHDNWNGETAHQCNVSFITFGAEDENWIYNTRPNWCPLIEIPTPHGRLIDKDKLRHELFVNFNGERIPFYDCDNFPTKIAYRDLHSILAEQKTVIEAEGREE